MKIDCSTAQISSYCPQKVFIKTFGCQMNEYDSARMLDLLRERHNIAETQQLENADIVIFNTCSVREKAAEKLFSELGRLRTLKTHNPNLIIAVGGCVASQEGDDIIKRAPNVDIVFGPQTLHRLPDLISLNQKTRQKQVDISFPEIEKFDHLPMPRTQGSSAFLSIMEGCSKYCSFCVVPYTRGEEVSRPFSAIYQEAIALAKQGVKEITLLGQNVNAYRTSFEGIEADLAFVIERIAEIPQIQRIRFTTSHPNEMSERLIACFSHIPKLAQQIHLPVQAGSDRILCAMKRNYTGLQYRAIIRQLRNTSPLLSITSDFIVGFPGETEQDFESTLKLIQDIGFDFSFSFVYSQRPGTPAAYLPDETPADVKRVRLQQLQELISQQGAHISAGMLGTRQRVLLDEVSNKYKDCLCGRTDNGRMVDVVADADLCHQFATVQITDVSNPWRLQGKLESVFDSP